MDEALTVKEAAKKLKVSTMTIYRLVNGGRIKAFRTGIQNHGGGVRIWPRDLEAFTDQPTEEATTA